MGKVDDIPQDVFEAAFSVVSEIQMQDAGSVESWDARASVARVARAILAEREKVEAAREFVKRHPSLSLIDLAEFEAFIALPAAIRKGSD